MKDIIDAVKSRLHEFSSGIAQAISDSDWKTVFYNAGIALVVVLGAVALAVVVLVLVGKILGTLLGKVFAVPLVLFILGLSYKMNLEDSRKARRIKSESATLDEWAEEVYGYVLNALFLVFRSVSEYTNIITPTRASSIELIDNPYTIEDGYVVFNFVDKVCGPIDTAQFKADIQRTLRQMHRAHELNGIPRDLTEINGSYYCPLQILGKPQDFGDYVQVSVVFATEKTVALTRADKLLNLDNTRYARRKRGETLTDDEL